MKNVRKIAIFLILILMVGLLGGIQTGAAAERQGQRFDFDGSRGRTVADAVLLLREIDHWNDGIVTVENGDVSGDGKITLYDAICFIRLLLNDTFDMAKALKVATYNIKAGYYSHDTMSKIAQLLKDESPDIVGIQEVDLFGNRDGAAKRDQIKYLAEKAGYKYYHFSPVVSLSNTHILPTSEQIAAGTNLYGHGILSKYPLKFDKIIYPAAQLTDGELRAVERYEITVGDKVIAFYNSHFVRTYSNEQYKEIQNNYMIHDEYAIFVGDMNLEPNKLTNLNSDRFELLTDYDPYDTTPIDHIIVSNDTFAWYSDTVNEVENVTAFTVVSYPVTPFEYTSSSGTSTVTKASDHNYRYAYLMLKDA